MGSAVCFCLWVCMGTGMVLDFHTQGKTVPVLKCKVIRDLHSEIREREREEQGKEQAQMVWIRDLVLE
jgi:hypothetical protein